MLSRRSFLAASAALPAASAQDRRSLIRERAAALAAFAGQKLAQADAATLERASRIAAGTVYFYSRTPVEVGLQNIDWSGAHIHHQEWPAQLNRFFHLGPLASAYAASGDEKFARAARAYIDDWMRDDPYADKRGFRPGDNALTMSIRLGTSVSSGWGGTLPAFLASPSFDDAFLDRVFASLAHQADHLSRNLTAAGNWRISELDALAFTSLRFPFLPNAAALLDAGIAGMRVAVATQFLPDGVHIERTPGYADWMTQVAANYFVLAKKFPNADAKVDPARVAQSLDYGAHSELFGVNDSIAPHRDPARLTRLATRAETLDAMGLRDRHPAEPPLEQVFASAGQVFARTAWKPGADYLAFDASTWGGGHSHLSRLSFVFRSGGRMLVADPGIFTYEMSDPMGPYGKSTGAHTTLNVGGWNQSGADAQLLRTAFTPEVALIHARYQGGYWKGRFQWGFREGRGEGVYGEHERILLWVKHSYVLVIDAMTTEAGQQIRNLWQMGPMQKWEQDAPALRWWSRNPDVNLLLAMAAPPPQASMECCEGRRDPLGGWVGFHGNDSVPAPSVEFRYPAAPNRAAVSAVVAMPFTGAAPPSLQFKAASESGIERLEIDRGAGEVDRVAWTTGLALPVDDDARLLWTRTDSRGRTLQSFRLRQ